MVRFCSFMKALVVYYSRTGHTGKVAAELAKELQCDKEEIVDTVNRSGPIGWLQSGRQASSNAMTKLKPMEKDPAQYDIVIIGTPVWAANVSTPARTYIAENKAKFKKVAFFLTLGSRGAEATLKNMTELSGKTPAGTLAITAKDLSSGAYADSVKKFAAELKA